MTVIPLKQATYRFPKDIKKNYNLKQILCNHNLEGCKKLVV